MGNSATPGPQDSVLDFDGSPMLTKCAAGSRSWRTSNPGLLCLGVLAMDNGAFAQVLGVAVFQSPEQGRQALVATLADEDLAELTVEQALRRFITSYTPSRGRRMSPDVTCLARLKKYTKSDTGKYGRIYRTTICENA